MEGWIEPDQWYAQLATSYAAAAALITDSAGKVLMVKPTYRDYWVWPGGYVDRGEPPDVACRRELLEELSLAIRVGRLLVVDWAPPAGHRPRPIMAFVFDGGVLDDGGASIRMDHSELDDWGFFTPAEACQRLPDNVAPRVQAALAARDQGQTIYLPRHREALVSDAEPE